MKPEIDFAGRQLAGSRDSQDDYYGFCPLAAKTEGVDGLLLVLADGMGGHAGGSLASRLVVEAFIEHFCYSRGNLSNRLFDSKKASERRLLVANPDTNAQIRKEGNNLMVADRNSSNGTAVNGQFSRQPFDEVPLKEGDTLTLGEVKLDFTRG